MIGLEMNLGLYVSPADMDIENVFEGEPQLDVDGVHRSDLPFTNLVTAPTANKLFAGGPYPNANQYEVVRVIPFPAGFGEELAPAVRHHKLPPAAEAADEMIRHLGIEIPIEKELVEAGVPQLSIDARDRLVRAIYLDMVQACDCHDERAFAHLSDEGKIWPHLVETWRGLAHEAHCGSKKNRKQIAAILRDTYRSISEKVRIGLPQL